MSDRPSSPERPPQRQDLAARIAAARVELMVEQCPIALLVHLLNSLILAGVFAWTGDTESVVLLSWLAVIWLLSLPRAAIWWHWRDRSLTPPEATRIAGRLTALAIASGLAWGASALVIMPDGSDTLQAFVVVVIAGMTAGSVVTLAGHMPAFLAFLATATLPLLYRLLNFGDSGHVALGLMGGIYVIVLLVAARNLHRTQSDVFRLRFEREALIDDLTRQRTRAEAANEAKSRFLAMVSHELRTPLNAVIGLADILKSGAHGPLGHPKYKDYVRQIETSGRHLMGLIEELLDVTAAESGRMEVVEETLDPCALLTDCAALVAKQLSDGQLILDQNYGDPLPMLRTDSRRVRQCVLNLLSNAIAFTPPGGRLELRAGLGDDGGLEIAVSDTGIGMTAAEIPTALSFFGQVDSGLTRRHGGTGLGLPLTRQLMELHDGGLEIDSRKDVGTTVTLRFPAARCVARQRASDGNIA